MNINFTYHSVNASNRLEIHTAQKLEKLFNKYNFIIHADILFKKENETKPDKGMICAIGISTPGPRLYAESSHGNFETSISNTLIALERQLDRRKSKLKIY